MSSRSRAGSSTSSWSAHQIIAATPAATDWGQYGITANVIYPAILAPSLKAYLETEPRQRAEMEARVPVRYVGDPLDDLGPTVQFLASDASGYLTGHPFFIDGGAGRAPR